jgi:hypothetical protein
MRSLGGLLHAAKRMDAKWLGKLVAEVLFVGDDWAEDNHDVELVDEHGKVLAKRRFPEGLDGVTRLHALIAEHLPDPGPDPSRRNGAGASRGAQAP